MLRARSMAAAPRVSFVYELTKRAIGFVGSRRGIQDESLSDRSSFIDVDSRTSMASAAGEEGRKTCTRDQAPAVAADLAGWLWFGVRVLLAFVAVGEPPRPSPAHIAHTVHAHRVCPSATVLPCIHARLLTACVLLAACYVRRNSKVRTSTTLLVSGSAAGIRGVCAQRSMRC